MASESRVLRVGDAIHCILASRLLREIQDPRLKLVSISSVEVSKDLSYAKVFFSSLLMGSEMGTEQNHNESPAEILKALTKAGPYLRRLLAKELELRVVPELRFVLDQTSAHSAKISALIDQALDKKINK